MSAPSQNVRSSPARVHRLARAIFSTNHRNIGFGYLVIAAVAVLAGTILSWLMRIHLSWPNWSLPLHGPILPEEYLALVTMHGTLMLFFVLTVAPQSGFGNLILPAQIGARRMAFPRLNALGMWITAAGLAVLLCAFVVPGGSPIAGWTSYPPLSASALAGPGEGPGQDVWLASIALFAIGGTIGAVVMLTTIVKLRCAGMTWRRLPLTVWGWFTAALLAVPAFSVLLAAIVLLFCDRHLGSAFFIPRADVINATLVSRQGSGSPLLWLHLFWFFGHPEVYIAILPGMGLTSMVIANFSRRRVFAYRLMIATTLAIGLLGIVVWGHHMFVAGLNPFAGTAFAAASLAIAVPATAKVLSWLATSWRARPFLTTPMLFALGFVSLFISGGLSGIIVAQPILDEYLHNTFFIVGHFHLIMAMAGVFGLFCATYYWFPLLAHGRIAFRASRQMALLADIPLRLHDISSYVLRRTRRRTPPLRATHGPQPTRAGPSGLALGHPAPHHRRRHCPRPHPTTVPLQSRPHPAFTGPCGIQSLVRHHDGMGTVCSARTLSRPAHPRRLPPSLQLLRRWCVFYPAMGVSTAIHRGTGVSWNCGLIPASKELYADDPHTSGNLPASAPRPSR